MMKNEIQTNYFHCIKMNKSFELCHYVCMIMDGQTPLIRQYNWILFLKCRNCERLEWKSIESELWFASCIPIINSRIEIEIWQLKQLDILSRPRKSQIIQHEIYQAIASVCVCVWTLSWIVNAPNDPMWHSKEMLSILNDGMVFHSLFHVHFIRSLFSFQFQ